MMSLPERKAKRYELGLDRNFCRSRRGNCSRLCGMGDQAIHSAGQAGSETAGQYPSVRSLRRGPHHKA